MDVAKGVAEHNGGSHFASQKSEAYNVLMKPVELVRITIEAEGNLRDVPIEGMHFAMLRQIAYEVIKSSVLRDLANLANS